MNDIFTGDTKNYTLTFTDSDDNPLDLTGAAVWYTVKERASDLDTSALIQKKITSHTDATGGVTLLSLSATDTDIDPGDYVYDFQLVSASGEITTLTNGIIKFRQDITRNTV
jgi:hypothetical protein